ncbi:MAG: segregation ATPase FtsK/SpoIIIE, family [Microbacteriaceae bacterium]|nr:segregation ATPase FtsK/SpoIIIE, family [Microbacteriaceae bacterium]
MPESLEDPKRMLLLLAVGLLSTAVLLYVWWPLGTVVGGTVGVLWVARIGMAMQRVANAEYLQGKLELSDFEDFDLFGRFDGAGETGRRHEALDEPRAEQPPAEQPPAEETPVQNDPVRDDLHRLKEQLGNDYSDFARAARLVVSTQYASAARLQRDLHLPYSRARRLLTGLEQGHVVGPPTGSLPRQVLMPKERLPDLERMLADA